eukprot:7605948-Pyramimonas_sp.AAC.1
MTSIAVVVVGGSRRRPARRDRGRRCRALPGRRHAVVEELRRAWAAHVPDVSEPRRSGRHATRRDRSPMPNLEAATMGYQELAGGKGLYLEMHARACALQSSSPIRACRRDNAAVTMIAQADFV